MNYYELFACHLSLKLSEVQPVVFFESFLFVGGRGGEVKLHHTLKQARTHANFIFDRKNLKERL